MTAYALSLTIQPGIAYNHWNHLCQASIGSQYLLQLQMNSVDNGISESLLSVTEWTNQGTLAGMGISVDILIPVSLPV